MFPLINLRQSYMTLQSRLLFNDLLHLKFLQVHVGYTNCSDNQFTSVFLNDFHVGVVWYIKVTAVKKKYNVKNTADGRLLKTFA